MDRKPSGNGADKRRAQQNKSAARPGTDGKSKKRSAADTQELPDLSSARKKEAAKGKNTSSGKQPRRKKGDTPVEERTRSKLKLNKPPKREPMDQEEIDRQAQKVLEKPRKQKPQKPEKPLAPPKKPLSPYLRRMRKLLLGAITVLALVSVCIVLAFTVFFKIEEIDVEGKTRYNADDIIASSQIVLGDNLFLCRTSPGIKQIQSDFAYIEDVTIDKKLFNKIVITVSEAAPASEVESEGRYIVLSERGKILEINTESKYEVPTVLGAQLKNVKLSSMIEYGDENLKKYLDKIILGIKEVGLEHIRTVDLSDHSRIMLVRENGFKIILGGFENLDYKLKSAAGIIKNNVSDTDPGTLDVSLASSDGGKSYLHIGEEKKEEPKPQEDDSKKEENKDGEDSQPADNGDGGNNNGDDNTGDNNWDDNTGDNNWDDNTGDNNWDDNTGDNNWDDNTGDNNWDDNTGDNNLDDNTGDNNWDDNTGDNNRDDNTGDNNWDYDNNDGGE